MAPKQEASGHMLPTIRKQRLDRKQGQAVKAVRSVPSVLTSSGVPLPKGPTALPKCMRP